MERSMVNQATGRHNNYIGNIIAMVPCLVSSLITGTSRNMSLEKKPTKNNVLSILNKDKLMKLQVLHRGTMYLYALNGVLLIV